MADGDIVRPALDRDELCVGDVCLHLRGVAVRYNLVRSALREKSVTISPLPPFYDG